jgi:aryl-alcohol dehydrogenase-like predicted oxidoreductase
MQYVRVPGVTTAVSRVVLGTDWLGSRRFLHVAGRRVPLPLVDSRRNRDAFELLDGASEAGCSAFDTARSYDDSERLLGSWIRARRMRERVVVISKGAHPGPEWESRLSPTEISRDLERSLKALRTDYIDIYLLHYDDAKIEVGPIVDVLNRHISAGKIHSIGVSNWSTNRIEEANCYARKAQRNPFVLSSVQFSLASWAYSPWPGARSISGEAFDREREWYKTNDLCILAYASLAMGFFSSARTYSASGECSVPQQARLGDKLFLSADNLGRLKRTRALAHELGLSPGQVALAWVLTYDPKILAIIGARNVAAYVDAAGACNVKLSEAQRRWLYEGTLL